jgi:copper chaperone
MAEHHYKFNVTMTCGGCSGAVERVLKKLDGAFPLPDNPLYLPPLTNPLLPTGVKNYTVSLDTQTADITAESTLDYATVLEKIKKTGKTVNSGEADGVVQAI